ncbi:MAG: hypothetical protein IJY06_03530 [Oscillospiraceae bacterium]|nr:hypothetical protein [Oscillospiraceae bacterium]
MKQMTAMMTTAALCLGICSLPAEAEAEKNFRQDFFPDGFTQAPSVHHILLDNNEESFWIQPTFANSQEVYDFRIAWQDDGAMCEAYGLEYMSLVMQIDYRIDDGEWQYDAAWDEEIYGCDFVNGICWPSAGNWLCDNDTVLGGGDENMTDYENIKDALVWVYNDYYGYDHPNFDDENHTVTFRARYMLQYTDAETYETQAFFSDWSEEQSIGKDSNQGELTAPTALPAPQISNLQVLTEEAGNYYMTFELFYPIEMAYADYYYYNMNSWFFDWQGTVGVLYAEININNTGWQEVAVINGQWCTGGTRVIDSEDTDGIPFTDYDYIQLRVRQRYSEPLTNSYSNIISINSIELRLGDVNADGRVDAMDAAAILTASAAVGSGSASGLTAEQEAVAKVLGGETFSATDAAMVLTYAAAVGADYEGTLEEYIAEQ